MAVFARHCAECGEAFEAKQWHGDFCAPSCRKAFNNRRMVRGSELYDLIMTLRCDRKTATALKVWKLVCRMVAAFHDEDARERAGRKSWRSAQSIVARHSYLRATVISSKTWNVVGGR